MSGRIAKLLLLLITGGCLAGNAAPILTLTPAGGAVTGSPGQMVGFGFTIVNDTSYYLFFDNSYFCDPGQDPGSTTCTESLGTYEDFIANDGTVVAPMASLSEAYNPATTMGFGAYNISPTAHVGAIDSGTLVGTYMEYDGDPYNGGTQASGDMEISAPASVTVVAAVPEPSSGIFMAVAGLGALLYGWRVSRPNRGVLRASQTRP